MQCPNCGFNFVQKEKLTDTILVTSLVSNRDSSPRVDIQFDGDKHVQLDAEAAIKIGIDLIKTANGAQVDSFIFWFIMEYVFKMNPMNKGNAAKVLVEFREFREKLALKFERSQEDANW